MQSKCSPKGDKTINTPIPNLTSDTLRIVMQNAQIYFSKKDFVSQCHFLTLSCFIKNHTWSIHPLKVHKHEIFFQLFLPKPKAYVPKGLLHKIFENRIRFGRDIRHLNISAYAQPAIKFVPRMLSVRLNSFRVCSAQIYM